MDNNNYYYEPQGTIVEPQKNDKAMISMVCGIVGLVLNIVACFCCIGYAGIPLSIVAIVMAIMSKKDNNGQLSSQAKVGLITAIIGIVVFVVVTILAFCLGLYLGMTGAV